MDFEIRYVILDSNLVFNQCGPMSAGPAGWDDEAVKIRKQRAAKYIAAMNKKTGFYDKLEESILKEGVRNPILVRCGWCPEGKIKDLPLEMQNDSSKILVCDSSGGSRLMITQKHNMKIPCIITDFVGRFSSQQLLNDEDDILMVHKDEPKKVIINDHGVGIMDLPQIHFEEI